MCFGLIWTTIQDLVWLCEDPALQAGLYLCPGIVIDLPGNGNHEIVSPPARNVILRLHRVPQRAIFASNC